jgi:hypothetical protein
MFKPAATGIGTHTPHFINTYKQNDDERHRFLPILEVRILTPYRLCRRRSQYQADYDSTRRTNSTVIGVAGG